MPEKGEAMPELSARQNIVVIADEAHRSQYGFVGKVNEKTGEMSYGFASNLRDALPNASFIGFTGTPIEKTDANTRAVFGDYISIYDIQRAVADKATVPIYYESRISKLALNAAELPKLDAEFEEITEGRGADEKGKAQDEVGCAGGTGGRSETYRAGGRRFGGAFRETLGGDGRQGDDRQHEPPHLRGALQRFAQASARLESGDAEGRDDRER
jgi:hypothetical protein